MPPITQQIERALGTVIDPEIRRPITELGMVKSAQVNDAGEVTVEVYLTVAGCPMKDRIRTDVAEALHQVPGVTTVQVDLDVMSSEQREQLRTKLRGGAPVREVPFTRPGNTTRVYAVASGKGGVGKSSVTVNLAAALADQGFSVGVVDADIYGFSVPRMLGVTTAPTQIGDEQDAMILPPVARGVKCISIGMFVPGNQPVVWRGPMLHRTMQQFLSEVFFGDIDILLLDLPPGTGDVAISVGQLLPNAEILVVTTPQQAAAEVAERAGSIAVQTRQQVAGVIENMSWLELPDGSRTEVFGSGGGRTVANSLSRAMGADAPLLGQIPLDPTLREAGDDGTPVVLSAPDSPAAKALREVATQLGSRTRGLAGRSLGVTPVRH